MDGKSLDAAQQLRPMQIRPPKIETEGWPRDEEVAGLVEALRKTTEALEVAHKALRRTKGYYCTIGPKIEAGLTTARTILNQNRKRVSP